MLDKIKSIYFIGIGGAGMSALAYVLCKRGFNVAGSDVKPGHVCARLEAEGVKVYCGHKAEQVHNADAVVLSTAIHQDNCELLEAKRLGITILHRSDILAALINSADGVAVAGAHGKTTTSAMISCIAVESGIEPTVVVGGEVNSLGGNAQNGSGRFVIAEADESDGSFLKFAPLYAVVTNIENDHLDHYGTEENIYQAFKAFLGQIRDGGAAVICLDNPKLQRLEQELTVPVVAYAIDNPQAEYQARDICSSEVGTEYSVYRNNTFVCKVSLMIPGRHNILNSLAAFATAQLLGIQPEQIVAALKHFVGAHRRFETKGKIDGIWVVDDYAHHPTEIAVTLQAARQTKPGRLVCVFQPHRYTRTKLLLKEFGTAFRACDKLILTDIYSAGEDPIPGIDSALLAKEIKLDTGVDAEYIADKKQIVTYLSDKLQAGDLIMTVGAGDIYLVGERLVEALKGRNDDAKE